MYLKTLRPNIRFALCAVIVAALQTTPTLRTPAAANTDAANAVTIEIPASEDAAAIEALPAQNSGGAPYFALQSRPGGSFDRNHIKFDVSVIPANASIDSAQLRVAFNLITGTIAVEAGIVTSAWDEDTLNWNNKPSVLAAGNVETITAASAIDWPLKPVLEAWLNNGANNHGVVLIGRTAGTTLARASTRNGLAPPKLIVTYSTPVDNSAAPDLGDAPDSSNNSGQNNVAYPGGTLGNFPTVWQNTPAGQAAGPRHANASAGAILGDGLSREIEADNGIDQDGVNNILSGGPLFSNQDRSDDGWRNPNATFTNCARSTLVVRVRRPPAAPAAQMYLNAWFDGNQDGDWADNALCSPAEGQPRPSTEWIVRDFVVPTGGIAPGDFVDINVNTEIVHNLTPNTRHWLRFTLSDTPPPRSLAGQTDGRGPHASSALGSYRFGETEDYLQRTGPAGENGVLVITKTSSVAAASTPLVPASYRISVRHVGGTQPMEVDLSDIVERPFYIYSVVASGLGVSPLIVNREGLFQQGTYAENVSWRGTIPPDGELSVTILGNVLVQCGVSGGTARHDNTARARAIGGVSIEASASILVPCPGSASDNIEITPDIDQVEPDLSTDSIAPWSGFIKNRYPHTVTTGLYQLIDANGASAQSADATQRPIEEITLGPGESKPVDIALKLENEASAFSPGTASEHTPVLGFCVLGAPGAICPDAVLFPNLHGQLPITLTVRPRDLGDAPDSSNHAGAAMAAYPGVSANFPTVFDPLTGAPSGPRHRFARPFHLGPFVSHEAEADIGPDQDALNNLIPAANNPDNDQFDDGTNLALWNLQPCQTTVVPVRVSLTPAGVAALQQLGTPGFLNIWIDANHDGDWADAAACGATPTPEHIVIDQPINAAALGAGMHTVNVPTGLLPPGAINLPAWVRITLSDVPSIKTLNTGGVQHGDGRGAPTGFRFGETEDYLYVPNGGPNVAVQLQGAQQNGAQPDGEFERVAGGESALIHRNWPTKTFTIRYENRGSAVANNVEIAFDTPEQLIGGEIRLIKSSNDDVVFAPVPTPAAASASRERIAVPTPVAPRVIRANIAALAPGRSGSITLSWYGCITCTLAATNRAAAVSAADIAAIERFTASVRITATADIDLADNAGSDSILTLPPLPTIGALIGSDLAGCENQLVTEQVVNSAGSLLLAGNAAANQPLQIRNGATAIANPTTDANGNYEVEVQLPVGSHRLNVRYASASPYVDTYSYREKLRVKQTEPSPFSALHMCLGDTATHELMPSEPWLNPDHINPPTPLSLNLNGPLNISIREPISGGVRGGGHHYAVAVNGQIVAQLDDADADGMHIGSFAIPVTGSQSLLANAAAPTQLSIIASNNAGESTYTIEVQPESPGMVRDRASGQALAAATVTLLSQTEENQRTQQTDTAGAYRHSAPSGIYQLSVTRAGYQTYRTDDIDAATATLNPSIALTPLINEPAARRVYMTDQGFEPALAYVPPGAVIEFINIGLNDHSVSGNGWDSGALATGESYKARLTSSGRIVLSDGETTGSTLTLLVSNAGTRLFMPLAQRQ